MEARKHGVLITLRRRRGRIKDIPQHVKEIIHESDEKTISGDTLKTFDWRWEVTCMITYAWARRRIRCQEAWSCMSKELDVYLELIGLILLLNKALIRSIILKPILGHLLNKRWACF